MNLMRRSIAARWTAAWVLVSVLLTGVTQILILITGKDSYLGNNAFSQLLFLLIFSLPWFLWAETFSRLVLNWKKYSNNERYGTILLLLLITILLLAELFFAALGRADLGY